ncbi:MAG: ATP-binding cassette domain-containing protein [Desulfobacteraceae bacterium]|nr:ATP-binding cassette domain-containing protein [Desulfobacteraceae bacterium]
MKNNTVLENSLADVYQREIENHIAEAYHTDALEKLRDFARDFSPSHKNEVLAIYSRYATYKKQKRTGLNPEESLSKIVDDLLAITDVIRKAATVREQTKIGEETTFNQVAEEQVEKVKQLKEDYQDGGSIYSKYSLDDVRQLYLDHWKATIKDQQKITVAIASEISASYKTEIDSFKLEPISFKLQSSEITGVVGMNASGKTTLLKLLLGKIKCDQGSLSYPALSNENEDWIRIKSQIGYVAQLPERWSGRLINNLRHTAAAYGITGKDNTKLVEEYVARYDLRGFENSTWGEISGGYKIRFELVRALLSRPKLLVLDEPLAYLDIVAQQTFLRDLKSIAYSLENPIPVIVTSQHLHEIESIADQMIVIDDGKCLYSGSVNGLPEFKESWIFEISINGEKKNIISKLRPIGMTDVEVLISSYIVFFSKESDRSKIVQSLFEEFGNELVFFRDVSKSTRSLFRNRRDDLG